MRLGNSAVALVHRGRVDAAGHPGDSRAGAPAAMRSTPISPRSSRCAPRWRAPSSICAASPEKDYTPIFGAVEEAIDDERGYDAALADYSPEAKTALCAEVIETLTPRGQFRLFRLLVLRRNGVLLYHHRQ